MCGRDDDCGRYLPVSANTFPRPGAGANGAKPDPSAPRLARVTIAFVSHLGQLRYLTAFIDRFRHLPLDAWPTLPFCSCYVCKNSEKRRWALWLEHKANVLGQ